MRDMPIQEMTRERLIAELSHAQNLNAVIGADRDRLARELAEARAGIQTCKHEHKYLANSHEYPCPWCLLAQANKDLAEARAEIERLKNQQEHPMQPVLIASGGIVRFKENRIVTCLLQFAAPHGFDMNKIASLDFTPEDRMQFAQLIGYSVSGYGELSYTSDDSYKVAIQRAEKALSGGEQKGDWLKGLTPENIPDPAKQCPPAEAEQKGGE